MEKEKIVGILGGMGPEATIEFMYRIMKKTTAQVDNDHIHCIVDQNAKVPNRVKSIKGEIASAGPVLAKMAEKLEEHGADLLCMPCNTAHYYLDEIQKASKLPFIDMLTATVEQIKSTFPDEKKVGILATLGTIDSGLYDKRLKEAGYTPVHPNPTIQDRVSKVIASVKAGQSDKDEINEFKDIVTSMRNDGINIMIAACTELSVICPKDDKGVIDALDCLVAKVVSEVKG